MRYSTKLNTELSSVQPWIFMKVEHPKKDLYLWIRGYSVATEPKHVGNRLHHCQKTLGLWWVRRYHMEAVRAVMGHF